MNDFPCRDAGTGGSNGIFKVRSDSGRKVTVISTPNSEDLTINHLKNYEIIIVLLYLPSNSVLRNYLSNRLEHLDALSGDRILIISFDPIKNDAEKLIELWVGRLGREYEKEIREKIINYVFDERTIYRIADDASISYVDLPCVLISSPVHTKASMIRIPSFERDDELEEFFIDIIDVAKESLGLRANDLRVTIKKIWKRKLRSLKPLLVHTNSELDFFAAQLTQLKKSVVRIVNPLSFVVPGMSNFISKLRDSTHS